MVSHMNQTITAIASEIGCYWKNEETEFLTPESFNGQQECSWNSRSSQEENLVPERSVRIIRSGNVKLFPFTDFFQGFDKVEAVRSTFGARTEEVLRNLKVEFFSFKFGYMAVSDVDGHILVSTHHLQNSDFKELYLDVIHELVHVKQFMEGRELFNSKYEYVDNPTEIEAYKKAVSEARRIGMTEEEIVDYLKVEWLNEEMHRRLVETVGIEVRA
jgi:hypothetical protein